MGKLSNSYWKLQKILKAQFIFFNGTLVVAAWLTYPNMVVIALLCFAGIITTWSHVLLCKRLLIPIELVADRIQLMTKGIADVDLPHGDYGDEIGIMLKALSSFKDSIHRMYEQASLLRLAEDVAHLGNWKLDVINQTLIWSDEVYRIYGVDKKSFKPDLENAIDAYIPSDRQMVKDNVQQAIDYKIGFRMEAAIQQPSGKLRNVEARGMCELNEAGEVIAIFGTFQDITERKSQERELDLYRERLEKLVFERTKELSVAKEQAEQASRSKTEFLSNMSHELRTPMHAILSYASMGIKQTNISEQEKMFKYFNNIHTSGKRLMRLLNDLLDLSKLEAGKMDFNIQPESLLHTIEKSHTELQSLLDEKHLKFSVYNFSNDAEIMMDSLRIMQVIVNILSNAIKFSPPNAEIKIDIEDTNLHIGEHVFPAIQCSIADEGIGIPEDELHTVFDKFIQSSKTKTGAGGTGLGLSICREIILAHNGTIIAENKISGGAVFKFILPREQIKQELKLGVENNNEEIIHDSNVTIFN